MFPTGPKAGRKGPKMRTVREALRARGRAAASGAGGARPAPAAHLVGGASAQHAGNVRTVMGDSHAGRGDAQAGRGDSHAGPSGDGDVQETVTARRSMRSRCIRFRLLRHVASHARWRADPLSSAPSR
eukprot:1044128-Prorocentrum_minimum.AAC.1